MSEESTRTAAYLPFKTFLTGLDYLKTALPPQLDKTAWPSLSGSSQLQMMGALRFFGLIDASDAVQPELKTLVDAEVENRKALIKKHLTTAYDKLRDIDLSSATPLMLDEALKDYNVTGSTLRKAVTFYVQAAQFAGIKVSPSIEKKSRTARSPRKRRTSNKANTKASPPVALQTDEGSTKTVSLASNGTVTLSVSIDVLRLAKGDRDFVLGLVDMLNEYENQLPPKESEVVDNGNEMQQSGEEDED